MATAAEYRLLGLRPREARLEVIRSALSESAAQVRDGEGRAEDDQRVAEVALAGYRLMDPRRRPTLVERVQLLLWSEEELERPTSSLFDDASAVAVELSGIADQTLATAQPGTRVSELAGSAHNVRKETGRVNAKPIAPGEPSESEVALDVFRMLQQRDRHASALRIAAVVFVLSLLSAGALIGALVLA